MGNTGAPPLLGVGHGSPNKNKSPPHVLPRQIWSFCIKGCTQNRREPQKWKRCGPPSCSGGVADPIEICPFPTRYQAEFGRFRSNGTSVIKEIHLKNFTASHLSRSLQVIKTDTYRSATYDFLLTFHSNHGPISYRFRDKRRFQSKNANFSHPSI